MTITEKILGACCCALMIALGFFLYETKFASDHTAYCNMVNGVTMHQTEVAFLENRPLNGTQLQALSSWSKGCDDVPFMPSPDKSIARVEQMEAVK